MAWLRWEILDAEWDDYFSILVRLHREDLDVNAGRNCVIDGIKVGKWVKAQRDDYRNSKLSAERIARLEAIGFKWNSLDIQREDYFAILALLHREGKDVNVRQDLAINGFKIGDWITKQRQAYKLGKLSAEQIASLEAVGFKWINYKCKNVSVHGSKGIRCTNWEECCNLLERHSRKGGNANVTYDTVIFGVPIGRWATKQRRRYRAGGLSAERIARLEAIGFGWEVRELNAEWVKRFAILEKHQREGGNINELARGTVIDGAIWGWINYQRHIYWTGKLSAFRIAELESIGFRWEWETRNAA